MTIDIQSIDAIIFDLANTIVENKEGFNPRNEAQFLLGLPSQEHVRNLIYTLSADHPGMTSDEFAQALVLRTQGKLDAKLINEINEVFIYNNQCLKLRPETPHVLQTLRAHKVKLALVSNCTPFARLLVNDLELDKYFDVIILSSDVGYMKPDPRIFTIALEKLGVSPEKTFVVGDKVKTDILGGTLAGCKTILLEIRNKKTVTNPKLPVYAVIKSLADMLELPAINAKINQSFQR